MDAAKTMPLMKTPSGQRFLIACSWLPILEPRIVYRNKAKKEALTPAEFAKLDEQSREGFEELSLDEKFYFNTKYGSPLAYARALDLICQHSGEPRGDCLPNKRIFDFGYGGIGHLRLLASLGCDVIGVDIDPLLRAYYREPEDQGVIEPAGLGGDDPAEVRKPGHLKLLHGFWPGDEKIRAEAGGDYDIIISKNTLKKGYITPRHEVDPRMLVHLGVSTDEFLARVSESLKPGGHFMIYNICPAQKPDPKDYMPWADGGSPFTKEQFEKAGLSIIKFDEDDTETCRKLGKALRWDEDGMDLEKDLFAWFTLVRKSQAGK